MSAYVYILRNLETGRHYIGSTSNLARRLADHARGNTPSTRKRGPWELVYSEECVNLAAARRRERTIKAYKGGGRFKALLLNPSSQCNPAEREQPC